MGRESAKIRITKNFVQYWSDRYDEAYLDKKDYRDEQRLKRWLARQSSRRFLDKNRFRDIAMWKTPRGKHHYEANSTGFVRQVTEQALQASDDRLRLHVLMALDGVGVPVASTILHFAFPDTYPILDVRALRTLARAGYDARGSTPADWLKYTRLMGRLAKKLEVDLRTLDKALWAFDKYGGKVRQGESS